MGIYSMEHLTTLGHERTHTLIKGASKIKWTEVKVVSWDVDGTLYNMKKMVREVHILILHLLFKGHWLVLWRALRALKRHLSFVKMVRAQEGLLEHSIAVNPWTHPDHEVWIHQLLLPAIHRTGVQGFVIEYLSHFSSMGVNQIIVSDFKSHDKLHLLGLTHYFSAFFAGEEIGYLKPSPELFTHVLSEPSMFINIPFLWYFFI